MPGRKAQAVVVAAGWRHQVPPPYPTGRCRIVRRDRAAAPRYCLARMSEPLRIEDVLHRVNNLLAVIQTQVEVARALHTEAAQQAALETIEASAQRTARDVRQFRDQQRQAGNG
jgi:signal transduction histidine kinase